MYSRYTYAYAISMLSLSVSFVKASNIILQAKKHTPKADDERYFFYLLSLSRG